MYQYPCIGRWSFLRLHASHAAGRRYGEVLARLTAPGSRDALLDLGCCVGQALRQLAADGVDGARLFGTDLHREFIELGYELFRDRDTFAATFAAGDMLKQPAGDGDGDSDLSALEGKVTMVYAGNFFHLFTWDQQVVIARRLVERCLRPGTSDALFMGTQIGSVVPGEVAPSGRSRRYWHDGASFQRLWDDVGAATSTAWRAEVNALSDDPVPLPGFGKDTRYLRWTVSQVV